MMDSTLLFGESMSIAANAAAVTTFTNIIDLGLHYDHKGNVDTKRIGLSDSFLNIVVEDEAIVAAAADTITFKLYVDDDTTPVGGDLIMAHTVPVADTTLNPDGTLLVCARIPEYVQGLAANGASGRRYLGLSCLIGGQNVTAGKVTAWIGPAAQAQY